MTNDLENNPQLQKMVEYAHKEGIHEKSAELSSLESFKLWLLILLRQLMYQVLSCA